MNNSPKPVNILLIRSAARIFHSTLQALKKEFPDSTITVLAPEAMKEAAEQDPLVDEVMTLGNHRRMSVFNCGKEIRLHIRKRRFDLAVSLYNVDHGLGYSNIDRLAWASKAKEIRGYNPKGNFVRHTGSSILKKSILEKTTLVWIALNYLATGVLFFLITLGLVGEWCVRKLLIGTTQNVDAPFSQKIPDPQPIRAGAPSKAVSQI
jgi:hypothetical protein